MEKKQVIVVFYEEAKNWLLDFYAGLIQENLNNLNELVASGDIHRLIPDVSKLSRKEIIDSIGEFCLGENLAIKENASMVLVKLAEFGNDYAYECIWDEDNLNPEQRKTCVYCGQKCVGPCKSNPHSGEHVSSEIQIRF